MSYREGQFHNTDIPSPGKFLRTVLVTITGAVQYNILKYNSLFVYGTHFCFSSRWVFISLFQNILTLNNSLDIY